MGNTYLHLVDFLWYINVSTSKYTSPMDAMGKVLGYMLVLGPNFYDT